MASPLFKQINDLEEMLNKSPDSGSAEGVAADTVHGTMLCIIGVLCGSGFPNGDTHSHSHSLSNRGIIMNISNATNFTDRAKHTRG